jgi:hypothetical protein
MTSHMSRRQTYAARIGAPPKRGWAALLGVLALTGLTQVACFEPRYQSGKLECAGGKGGVCPGGFYCADDIRCWRLGEQPAPVEGPAVDAAVPDAGDAPPSLPPQLVTPASATPAVVTGTSTMLSVLAEDPQGEGSGLVYHWTVTGPGTVAFSVNSSSAARDTTAIFTKAGHYIFTVTIFNRESQSISSQVEVEVQARLNDLALQPPMATVGLNGMAQFMAMAFDQFGEPLILTMQPRWQLAGNCGLVNENGLFTGGAMMASGCTLFATIGSIVSAATVSVGTAQPTILNPIADSYVEDGSPDKNFGTSTVMHVKTQTNDATNNRTAYLKFSLAGVSGPITTVKFRLFGRAFGGTHMLGVFAVADTAWGETTITFKNRPPLGTRLLVLGVTTAPKYHEWDVTSHVQARLAAGDMLITLAVQMTSAVTVEPDAFDSKEANNKPQLVLTP